MPYKDKTKLKEYNRQWYHKNKLKVCSKKKVRDAKNKVSIFEIRERDYRQGILSRAKSNARIKGLDFNLDLDDINIPTHCPLLNVPLTTKQGSGKQWYNASIDRIDSAKGYVKGNVQIISLLANSMKHKATKEELIIFATNILKLYNHANS